MTFSIVATDWRAGHVGSAVATFRPAVGNRVPYVRFGVGAVNTQALIRISHGLDGLDLMAAGDDPDSVMVELRKRDPFFEARQVVLVNASGQSAAHTGSDAVPWAGHRYGPNYAIGGNMLVSEETVSAMETAFLSSVDADFADRLLAVLEAGRAAGGDKRGHRSAALSIATPDRRTYVDVRVDWNEEPVAELRRAYVAYRDEILIPLAEGRLNWYEGRERGPWG